MKNTLLLFLIVLLTSSFNSATAQKKWEKKYNAALQEKNDTLRILALYDLADKVSKNDLNDALYICEKMKSISNGNAYLEGISFRATGLAYRRNSIFEKSMEHHQKARKIFLALNNSRQLTYTELQIGWLLSLSGKKAEATPHFKKAVDYALSTGDPDILLDANDDYCDHLWTIGENALLFTTLTEQIAFFEKSFPNRNYHIAAAYIDLAYYFFRMDRMPDALKSVEQAIPHAEKSGDELQILDCYNTSGSALKNMGREKEAITYFLRSAEILERSENAGLRKFLGPIYTNLGITYYQTDDFKKGLEYKIKGLKCCEQDENTFCIYNSNIAIGIDLVERDRDYERALSYLHVAEGMVTNFPDPYPQQYLYKSLYQAYEGLEKHKEAFIFQTRYLAIRDSILNSEKQKQLSEMEAKYENSKKEQQIEMLNRDKKIGELSLLRNQEALEKEKAENEARQNAILLLEKEATLKHSELERQKAETEAEKNRAELADQQKRLAEKEVSDQRRINLLFGSASLLLIVFLFSLYRGYLQKKKANEEILEQKTIIERQKEIVEEKNKEVMDSITYAKRLQDAILPPLSFVQEQLKESFVLYRPKDIVAGDFYWMEQRDDLLFFAVADCTGHGVPGAMVSVVCSNALHRAVKEFGIHSPARILDKVTELVLETFSRSESQVRDGMDISLCVYKRNTRQLIWAGANNPLWILRDGEIGEIKPDKQPVGSYENRKPFNEQMLDLKSGDLLYLFSDGYCDQFGGPKGKKFKEANLKKLLLSIFTLPMESQKKSLDAAFVQWRGELEQIDDICIMGVRVS